jgi:hypothetical protein
MGCTDSLRVTSHGLRAGQTIEVCTVDECVLAAQPGGTTFEDIAPPAAKHAEVVLRIHENGVVALEQRRDQPVGTFRPNGGRCPPECRVVEIVVDERGFV